jgi:hypothetical protein
VGSDAQTSKIRKRRPEKIFPSHIVILIKSNEQVLLCQCLLFVSHPKKATAEENFKDFGFYSSHPLLRACLQHRYLKSRSLKNNILGKRAQGMSASLHIKY